MLRPLALACTLIASAAAPMVHAQKAATLVVEGGWARPTVAGQPAGGAFLTIRNGGDSADRLVSASSPAAAAVQLHQMKMEGTVMRMHEVAGIDVPARSTVALAPGQYHLMLMGLKAPLTVGQPVPLTLHFEKAGEVPAVLKVQVAAGVRGQLHPEPDQHEHH